MFEDIINRSLKLNNYIKFALRGKKNFLNLLKPFQEQIDYILSRFEMLIYIFSIEKATGAGLDFIGIIVKRDRITANYTHNNFIFDSQEQGFDSGVFDVGGDLIPDDKYRLLLKSKILKNNAKGWYRDELITYHKMMLPDEGFNIEENDGEVNINFDDELDDFSYQLLSQYPVRIAGIKVNYNIPV